MRRGAGQETADAVEGAPHTAVGLGCLISHFQEVNGRSAILVTRTLAPAVDSPSHTVLVVDDDPAIRFLCRVNLELEGWAVREAGTISEARDELAGGTVRLVLLDVHVGNESGTEFLAEIRDRHAGLPVALLTGSVGTSALRDGGAEADAVITKPFRPEELTDTVARLAQQPGEAG
ncbi:MAG: hypothetical protein QOG93_1632 [Gaiellaceae bacterium]|nr:hypothetical protein [Gaiellaceae bacterium]